MSTPHSIVMAAVRCIQAGAGMDPEQKGATAENECGRVCSVMKTLTFDHSDATRVLEGLQEQDVWTAEQKKRIGASVQLALSGLANAASDATRTCSKAQ